MGTVERGSNATAAAYPADTDTKLLGGSEALPCAILCPASELVSQVASAQVCLGSWGEGSFCFWSPITPLVFWGASLGLIAGSGNSRCYQAKYIKLLWQNPKRLRPRRTPVVEKHISVQLWDPLQVGAQTCQREAFFSATSTCGSFSTVTFNEAVSINSLLCLMLCKQMKQINGMENKARGGKVEFPLARRCTRELSCSFFSSLLLLLVWLWMCWSLTVLLVEQK